jgi:hypothetical protein
VNSSDRTGIQSAPWTTTASLAATGHTYLASSGPDATTVLLGALSALVSIGIAVTGWTLLRRYRRRDHEHADLTELSQLLRRLYVQTQTLADQDGAATTADLATLRTMQYELGCAPTPSDPDLNTMLANVTSRLEALFTTAIPTAAGPGTLKQARQQGGATREVLTAVKEAQALVDRLRGR